MGQIIIPEQDEDEALSLWRARHDEDELAHRAKLTPSLPDDLLKRIRRPTYRDRIVFALALILMVPAVLATLWVVSSFFLSLERLT